MEEMAEQDKKHGMMLGASFVSDGFSSDRQAGEEALELSIQSSESMCATKTAVLTATPWRRLPPAVIVRILPMAFSYHAGTPSRSVIL
mmetsp:Transcript_14091/g.52897  ORF Transcript_14091/g.52897 Transcript_14091/m.52897 type:complete len:88 (+) Transcript_14091:756-1019(+)